MAKPNYSFEKRQRELAKKRKKDDKLAEKAARKAAGGLPEQTEAGSQQDQANEQGQRADGTPSP